MEFFEKMSKRIEVYYEKNSEEVLNEIIKSFAGYLHRYAEKAHLEAKRTNVYIPYEDFYSTFLLTFWETIEAYKDIENSSFHKVLAHRLYFAKCGVWRTYQVKTKSESDKNGISYEKTRWSTLENVNEIAVSHDSLDEQYIFILDKLEKYASVNPLNYQVINYLICGFTPLESLKLAKICSEHQETYTNTLRKKVQRIRNSFQQYLES